MGDSGFVTLSIIAIILSRYDNYHDNKIFLKVCSYNNQTKAYVYRTSKENIFIKKFISNESSYDN